MTTTMPSMPETPDSLRVPIEEVRVTPAAGATIDIVVPVYNEVRALEPSVQRLHQFLSDGFPFSWQITIVDNASTDETWAAAQRLAAGLPGVRA